ncbi:unnamed protein product [Closterium sp. NIES-65]|nr:unnamed protein product [Closterium sp. NIES-65]
MASPPVLAFDAEGCPLKFDTWLDHLHLFLQLTAKEDISLYDHALCHATAPAATADSTARSQWQTRDAHARFVIRNSLPIDEREHFGQHKTAQALYTAVVAHYSSRASAALGRLSIPYLFPDLASFHTVADLITLLRTSEARFCATMLDGGRGGGRGGGGRGGGGGTGGRGGNGGGQSLQHSPSPQDLREWYARHGGGGGLSCTYVIRTGDRTGQTCGRANPTQRYFSRLDDAWRTQFPDATELPCWADQMKQNIDIFALDFDAILSAMYATALGARVSTAPGAGEVTALGAGACTPPVTESTKALHTFTLDSGASRCFFCGRTAVEQLARPVAVSLADPSGGPVLATSSTLLPCPAVPSGTLFDLYLPSFSTNLVAGSALQDRGVHQFTPAYERVTHCTCARTGRHLATFTRQPGSDLYTLTTESPQVAACASASGQLVLPPLPPSPAPPCLPCVKGRQRAAPHSSSFPPTTAPLQTLHMDVWGPARVRGQGQERYFLIVVNDYSRYTTVFPLHTKGEVPDVLIPWIRASRLQLSERFHSDFPVLRLHSDRGSEFSSDLLAAYYAEHGIHQSFTLLASPQQNGAAKHRIGLVMEVARTSLIHAAAPHFLWLFAVRYAAHHLNLWPRVSLPETSPTLRWTGEVGDASRFRVWGSRAFVRDTSADKLSSRAVPCVFLGFVPDAAGWQFYHPTSRRVLASQDVTFDESVLFYRLFPYRTAPLPRPPLFLAPDPVEPVEVAVDSRPARGAEPECAEPGVAETGGAEPGGAESGGADSGGAERGSTEPAGAESGGAEPGGAEPGSATPGGALSSQQLREWYLQYCSLRRGAAGAGARTSSPRQELTSPQRLREWYARRCSLRSGAPSVADPTNGAADPGVGAATGAADPCVGAAAGTTDLGVGNGAGAADPGIGAAAGAADPDVGGAGGATGAARGSGVVSAAAGGTSRPRPYFIPLLQQRVPLPSPPESSLPALAHPVSDSLRAASPTVTRLLATAVTNPSFESAAASALVAELVDFAARCRLNYAASLVAESESVCPPSVGGEGALSTDVLEDRQEDLECLAAATPHLVSMLVAPERDSDAPDISTTRSYAEAMEGPYSSQWQSAMETEMASSKSTGTYVNEVPPPWANIVNGMWIFRVKRPPGSPPVFKARYVARGFSQREGVDFFQTFSLTPKMTTLWVLLRR